MDRPGDLFDRETEWEDLVAFSRARGRGLDVGIVHGRRRQGKSFLLRRLCAAAGGVYVMALEEERVPALARFADGIAAGLGVGAGQLRFSDWESAVTAAIGSGKSAGGLLVIDEFPYLLRHSPELPSVLQRLVDDSRQRAGGRARLILCGSALSVMSELLSGAKALRGRARLDLRVRPFDFRQAARFWGIRDPELAFRVDAIFGGTPGYLDLVGEAPAALGSFPEWLAGTVLNPSHALFGEAGYLLREDPRVTDRAVYQSVLAAVAAGVTTPRRIAERVGRDERSLPHPLEVLLSAGFLRRDDDVLLQRRPVLSVADPIVRFALLVVAPRLATFEERRAGEGWAAAAETFSSLILGPHFEHLARQWTARHAPPSTWDAEIGEVGGTVVNDPAGRARHEVDVVGLAVGERRQAKHPRVVVLGEAKSASQPRRIADVERLDRIRALLVARGVRADGARLALFGRSGFDAELRRLARRRADVVLVDLATLYGKR
jgi:uncharacterized protein